MSDVDVKKYLKQLHFADVEAKGFWEDVNSPDDVWCFCSITEDDTVILWHDYPELDNTVVIDPHDEKEYIIPPRCGSLLEGARYWYMIGRSGGKLAVHNCFSYDKPIIEKIWPKCEIPEEAWTDTFNLSKVQWFDRPIPKGAKGPHGLDAYGRRVGIMKPPITDFSKFDAYMLHRVIEDCRIQKETTLMLEKEAQSLKELGITFDEAMSVENKYTANCQRQEVQGAYVDKDHILSCIEFLDKETIRLEKEIEPNLPPTVKPKSTRISRGEMAKLFGMKTIKEEYDVEGKLIKQYYKPTINYTRAVKGSSYSGFNLSYGDSPTFSKKRDLTSWIKEHHPDTKPKDWGIEKEEVQTTEINSNTCEYFGIEPDSPLVEGPFTRVEFLPSKLSQHEVVKGYLIKLGLKEVKEWNLKKDDNGIVRAEKDTWVVYPKKAHPDNQLKVLCKRGQPLYTSPKISEDDYEQLPEGLGKDIATYNTYMHRRRFLSNPKDPEEKGILAYVRDDGRIPCGVNNFNTTTGRSSHRVIVNLPSESASFGKEMRQCIIAPEGKVLVGADQKSSQLSIAAFVSNNVDYYEAVASGEEFRKDEKGNDIYVGSSAHCVNARNFALVSSAEYEEAVKTQNKDMIRNIVLKRKSAKGPAFGVLFGCSGKKLATMLKISEKEGNHKKEIFLEQMGLKPVIAFLKECSVKYKAKKGFYIPTAFGYWIYCTGDHKAVNYLIQSVEGTIQKMGVLRLDVLLEERGLTDKVSKVLDMHDEMLVETYPEVAEAVGKLMCDAYTWAGEQLHKWYMNNLDKYPAGGVPKIVPDFAGGYSVGQSYYECH